MAESKDNSSESKPEISSGETYPFTWIRRLHGDHNLEVWNKSEKQRKNIEEYMKKKHIKGTEGKITGNNEKDTKHIIFKGAGKLLGDSWVNNAHIAMAQVSTKYKLVLHSFQDKKEVLTFIHMDK